MNPAGLITDLATIVGTSQDVVKRNLELMIKKTFL